MRIGTRNMFPGPTRSMPSTCKNWMIVGIYKREMIRSRTPAEDLMAHKFQELQKKISVERRARVEERVRSAIKKMALDELRTAREFTQAELSQVLKVDQGSISKLERRTDMYIGTLRRYIEAMGGSLQIRAVFPDGEVQIRQFEDAK